MSRSKSEGRIVSEGRRKPVPSQGDERPGGEKAAPVKGVDSQLALPMATADNPGASPGAVHRTAPDPSGAARVTAPKAKAKRDKVGPATMEEVARRLETAFEKVAANKGAAGPDGLGIDEVRDALPVLLARLRPALLEGTYVPGDIRRVWIPKAGGGERGLGIPNVVDRMVQEAVRAVLEPLYEPTFHPSSHGFRPKRGSQTAIAEARGYIDEGHEWVVDIDLEKFFDRVHHQRLMARLAERVEDKRLLILMGRMLKAQVVLPDGVKTSTEEGVPQGGPLSPLLSNIVLDELDQELGRRDHRFVRYADDCNIYVRSERAGQRVMEGVTRFIEKRLRLKVNADKSAVARPETRHFLGFRLLPTKKKAAKVLLSKRSETRLKERIRELTPRNAGRSLTAIITGVNSYVRGWFGYFKLCSATVGGLLKGIDAHIRRRLRAVVLGHWKRKRTIAKRLIGLGVPRGNAWRAPYAGRRSRWSLSHHPTVERGLSNAFFAKQGLLSIANLFAPIWNAPVDPVQLSLLPATKRS
jgi:RNA-directed DNA polymerase